MSWWIFIHSYLWHNSLRRWWEQPLSLLSKLVVAGLLGILGASVILGIKELGRQLDQRLNDREALTCIISETIPPELAISLLQPGALDSHAWLALGTSAKSFLQAPAYAELDTGRRLPVLAVENPEEHGLMDDFYILREDANGSDRVEFFIDKHGSEAIPTHHTEESRLVLSNRDVMLGSVGRLAGILSKGFTHTTVLRAHSVEAIKKAHSIVEALSKVEGRRIFIQSNLRILEELESIRSIQAQSLIWMTIGSSSILGLIFGSLTWMEFREERYLLALIRSFGVGRGTLLLHSLVENCILAISGVLLGFLILHFSIPLVDIASVNVSWLRAGNLHGIDGFALLIGAAVGGVLSCIPIAIGLRKPLGLVLT